jgi:hypothetical protein
MGIINKKRGLAWIAVAGIAAAQTQIDLQTQSKRVDFSAAQSTKPMKSGNVLPATCSAGEVFLMLTGMPGMNIYTCLVTNTWVAQGGSTLPPAGDGSGQFLTSTAEGGYTWTALSGDLHGGAPAKVTGLQGNRLSSAVPTDGDVLMWAESEGEWRPAKGSNSSLSVEIDGVSKGSHSLHNYVSGTGVVVSATDYGGSLTLQTSVNTAVVQTRANAQSGTDLMVGAVSADGIRFEARMTPTLTSYSDGMVVQFRPDRDCSGAPTLNIDTLGAKNIYEADGVTSVSCKAGEQFPLWYDISASQNAGGWRKQGKSGGSPAVLSDGVKGEITVSNAGSVWTVNPLPASRVGLGNVANFAPASQAEAEAGIAGDRYMTPERTSQAIAVRVGNAANLVPASQAEAEAGIAADRYMTPQRTSQAIASRVGNVANYPPASQAEAEAGIAADRYMTPQRTSQAIASRVGNVANYAPASQAEAEAGIAADRYMTPERTSQTIASRVGNVANYAPASQAEAEAGIAADRYMTPERTRQAIEARAGSGSNLVPASQAEAEAGIAADRYMTPQRTKEAISFNVPVVSAWHNLPPVPGGSTIHTGVSPGSANTISLMKVQIPFRMNSSVATVYLGSLSGAPTCAFTVGLYSTSGTLLAGGANPINCASNTGATGFYTIPFSANISPGEYYLAWSASSASAGLTGVNVIAVHQELLNNGQSLPFFARTSAVFNGTNLPANLTISNSIAASNVNIIGVTLR